MGDCETTQQYLTETCKNIERTPSAREARCRVKSKSLLAGFSIFWKLLFWFFFSLWNWVCIFFSLQKYSYHNVTWWAAALWTQPGRNSSWTAAAKVWAHPFFVPFTLVNDVHFNYKPAMAILNVQPIVVNHIFFLKLKSTELGNNHNIWTNL